MRTTRECDRNISPTKYRAVKIKRSEFCYVYKLQYLSWFKWKDVLDFDQFIDVMKYRYDSATKESFYTYKRNCKKFVLEAKTVDGFKPFILKNISIDNYLWEWKTKYDAYFDNLWNDILRREQNKKDANVVYLN